jgi:predicted RecA/RadA family phage recombinase
MKNYSHSGDKMQFTAPSGGVVSGTCYKVGNLLVVAEHDAAEGATFTGLVRGVVTGVPKTTGATWSEGQLLYWDNSGKKFTTSASGNLPAGSAAAAAGSSDAIGDVRLNGVAAADAS